MPCLPCLERKASSTGPVKLNVGGQCFTTSRQTILKCPKLAEIVNTRPGPDGFYFIDRDGRYFAEILTFCRDGPKLFVPPTDETARRVLQHEATYFGLVELAAAVQDAYTGAKIPANETQRLAVLDGLNIMHTNEHEHHYDAITQVVAALLDVPICLISMVHTDHQWFKSRVGLEANQTSRNSSFCAMTFTPEDPTAAQMLVIEDAKSDGRTASNPLVTGEPFIGFYAGCPIVTSGGIRLGALCAIDHVPRSISSAQAQVLVNLAQLTAQEIEHDHLLNDELSMEFDSDKIPSLGDFAAGPMRNQRMREAIHEAVVLCKIRLDSNDWPLLYGNRTFTELSGVFLTPPQRLEGRATAFGPGMRYLRGAKSQEIGLWDWLHLSGKGEKQLRADVQASFEQPEAGIFALQATAPVMASGSHNMTRGSGVDRVRLSCRFMPCELPIDVAAQAIRPVPQRDAGKPGHQHLLANFSGQSRFYFVSVSVVGEACPKAHYQSTTSTSSTPTGNSQAHSMLPDASRKQHRKSTGQKVEAMKPARSPFQDVRLMKMVGQGSFGKVYYALWMGSAVAVKIIESKVSDKMKKFQPVFEAALSASISHPNLVQTFNYSTRAKPPEEGMEDSPETNIIETWMVQEWCDLGTLGGLAKKLSEAKDPLADIIDVCGDVSRAGSYLHARGIIHGDLTAANVLIKTQVSRKGYICKIADFGLARVLEGNNVDIMTTQLGTVTHMPPELFEVTKDVKLTTKADIYAMGMLMYQVFVGEAPYAGLSAPQVIVQVMKGKRLNMPDTVPDSLREVFERCTDINPKDRPTFDELVLIFGGALTQLLQGDGAVSPSGNVRAEDGFRVA